MGFLGRGFLGMRFPGRRIAIIATIIPPLQQSTARIVPLNSLNRL